jgi:hypothetical protein
MFINGFVTSMPFVYGLSYLNLKVSHAFHESQTRNLEEKVDKLQKQIDELKNPK